MSTRKVNPLLVAVIVVTVLIFLQVNKSLLRNQTLKLVANNEVLANYDKFQKIAKEKGIAMMPNDKALEVPEIKAVLEERKLLLDRIASNCTLEYKAVIGPTKTDQLVARCERNLY